MTLLPRKRAANCKVWQCIAFVSLSVFPFTALSQAPSRISSNLTNAKSAFVPPWNLEGESYFSYATFRDDLLSALKSAVSKIYLVSYAFSDGSLSSALYAARNRGVFVGLLIDEVEGRQNEPSQVLKQNLIVFKSRLSRYQMEGLSTLVIDESTWRLNARLDEKTPGAVRIDRSPFTSEEVLEWFRRPKQKLPSSPHPAGQISMDSAKSPTNGGRPGLKIFGTIRNEAVTGAANEKAIPRKLPRETRWQKLRRQGAQADSPSENLGDSSNRPPPSSREGDLGDGF